MVFFVPKVVIVGHYVDKPQSKWIDSESKKAQYNCIAKNIIISSVNLDEFFRVSQCTLAKEM